jgi:hypothetical protein
MTQADYEQLERTSDSLLSDAEAILRVNKAFGFEAGRIDILHEAEFDATEQGASYIQIGTIPRKPLYAASDWNYIRFNVRAGCGEWYYEMVHSHLHQISK